MEENKSESYMARMSMLIPWQSIFKAVPPQKASIDDDDDDDDDGDDVDVDFDVAIGDGDG